MGIDIFIIQVIITLESMPHGPVDGESALVLVMAWCRQATRHYLDFLTLIYDAILRHWAAMR